MIKVTLFHAPGQIVMIVNMDYLFMFASLCVCARVHVCVCVRVCVHVRACVLFLSVCLFLQ